MHVFATREELLSTAPGTSLGASSWRTVDQRSIDLFAEATDDHQWIHVDPERAADGPFGTTIAHGFLTVSLLPTLVGELYDTPWAGMRVNVGSDRVRFVAPVPVDARVRAVVEVATVEERGDAVRVGFDVTIELEGSDKPACVARQLVQVIA